MKKLLIIFFFEYEGKFFEFKHFFLGVIIFIKLYIIFITKL